MEYLFVLQQNIGKLKKGKTFDSFGGLVQGVVVDLGDGQKMTIKFYDTKWFKLKTKRLGSASPKNEPGHPESEETAPQAAKIDNMN